jgi:hypothetical protein
VEPDESGYFLIGLQENAVFGSTANVAVSGEGLSTKYIDIRNVRDFADISDIEIHVDEVLDFGSIPYGFPLSQTKRVWMTNTGDGPFFASIFLEAAGELENNISITERWDPTHRLPLVIGQGETAMICKIELWNDGSLHVGTYTSSISLFTFGWYSYFQESFDIQLEIVEPEDVPITLAFGRDIDLGTETVGYSFESGWTDHGYMERERMFYTGEQSLPDSEVRVRLEGVHANSFNLVCSRTREYSSEILMDVSVLFDFGGYYDFGIKPAMNLQPGIYEATVVVSVDDDIIETFNVRFEVEATVYAIELSPGGNHVFDRIDVGQSAPPHWINILNSGNTPTGELDITISGDNPDSFRLSRNYTSDLQRIVFPLFRGEVFSSSAYLVVTPRPNLEEGIHTATITISGDNIQSYSLDVSITVGDPQICIDCNECPGCEECFDCGDVEECECGSGYCSDCCTECDLEPVLFSITYNPNPQGNGTVTGTPGIRENLSPSTHTLSTGVPTHSPVIRDGISTNVVFRGWSSVATNQIFAERASLPTLLTSVTITDTSVTVHAVWAWGTCVECRECPTCEDCLDCDDVEECDCDSGYCADCCTECDDSDPHRETKDARETKDLREIEDRPEHREHLERRELPLALFRKPVMMLTLIYG